MIAEKLGSERDGIKNDTRIEDVGGLKDRPAPLDVDRALVV
jgi:hypothetical protein